MSTFELRGPMPKQLQLLLEIGGLIVFLVLWQLVAMKIDSPAILPSPLVVLSSFPQLHFEDFLIRNAFFSIKINLLGYLQAVLISIPLGMVIGLFTPVGAVLNRYVDAIRYIPLTAVTGLFIAWFGIYLNMKVQFLAFGIFVYLLPVVVQRVKEVDEVYVQTAETLGASRWQVIVRVFIPGVLSKLSDDIRVLTAISWTYIIVAEMVNNEGGLGALIFRAARQSRLDKVFAVLFVIIIIGVIQDKIFLWLDRRVFGFKYAKETD
ncbi:MAG: ABC transporter permease [Bacteroidota bacterium]